MLDRRDQLVKTEKCSLDHREVECLGMVIGNGKVKMDPIKVQGIAEWERPTTVKEVRSFLGFCNFYRAFIKDFSNIARPLNDLTKKLQKWDWTDESKAAFLLLKQRC